MLLSTAYLKTLGRTLDVGLHAELEPEKRDESPLDAVTTPVVAAFMPALLPFWSKVPSLLRFSLVAAAGVAVYTAFRVLRYVVEPIYTFFGETCPVDYDHPLWNPILRLVGFDVSDAPQSAKFAREAIEARPIFAPWSPDVQDRVGSQEATEAPSASPGVLSRAWGKLTGDATRALRGAFTKEETDSLTVLRAANVSFRGGKGMTDATRNAVARAESKYGIPSGNLQAMVMIESGGNPFAVSPTGAIGLLQFIASTARSYGLRNRFDPDSNIDAGARLYVDNARYLERAGLPTTLNNVYLLHQLGPRAVKLIRASQTGEAVTDDKLRHAMSLNFGDVAPDQYTSITSKKVASAFDRAQRVTAPADYYGAAAAPSLAQTVPATTPPAPTVVRPPAVAAPAPTVAQPSRQAAERPTANGGTLIRTHNGTLLSVH